MPRFEECTNKENNNNLTSIYTKHENLKKEFQDYSYKVKETLGTPKIIIIVLKRVENCTS